MSEQPPTHEFTYASGARPLDGYTVKRGIGRGGFGEVYYAVSDSGKEVALKLVQRGLDVEMRGVSQCLNLKNPHLLQVYDVRVSDKDEHFIIMEYVRGSSLREVVNAHPDGLPPEDVLAWLRGLADGVDYLHAHGVVHRDLNPANVFMEDGVVKIGDYGLSKFISSSVRQGHTESVGTVHYMAPEIGSGNYGPGIDIYALGVILFEMLTGRVPFDGESPGEVLMKHLTSAPPTDKLDEPFRSAVMRALDKRPEARPAKAVDLLASLAGSTGGAPAGASRPAPEPGARPAPPTRKPAPPQRAHSTGVGWFVAAGVVFFIMLISLRMPVSVGQGVRVVGHLSWMAVLVLVLVITGVVKLISRLTSRQPESPPPLPTDAPGWRPVYTASDLLGALMLSAIVTAIYTVFLVLGLFHAEETGGLLVACTALAGVWPTLVAAKFATGRRLDQSLRRVVSMTVGMGVGAIGWLCFRMGSDLRGLLTWSDSLPPLHRMFDLQVLRLDEPAVWVVYFGLVFLACRFWRMADPVRRKRVQLWDIAAAGLWALLVSMFWPFPQPLGLIVAVVAAAAIETASPWTGPPNTAKRRYVRRGGRSRGAWRHASRDWTNEAGF